MFAESVQTKFFSQFLLSELGVVMPEKGLESCGRNKTLSNKIFHSVVTLGLCPDKTSSCRF